MSISFTPVRRYPVQLKTTKTSAPAQTTIPDSSIYAGPDLLGHTRPSDKYTTQSGIYFDEQRKIKKKSRRLLYEKVEKTCPKYKYVTGFPNLDGNYDDSKPLPKSCKGANLLRFTYSSYSGPPLNDFEILHPRRRIPDSATFCATDATAKDKKVCQDLHQDLTLFSDDDNQKMRILEVKLSMLGQLRGSAIFSKEVVDGFCKDLQ